MFTYNSFLKKNHFKPIIKKQETGNAGRSILMKEEKEMSDFFSTQNVVVNANHGIIIGGNVYGGVVTNDGICFPGTFPDELHMKTRTYNKEYTAGGSAVKSLSIEADFPVHFETGDAFSIKMIGKETGTRKLSPSISFYGGRCDFCVRGDDGFTSRSTVEIFVTLPKCRMDEVNLVSQTGDLYLSLSKETSIRKFGYQTTSGKVVMRRAGSISELDINGTNINVMIAVDLFCDTKIQIKSVSGDVNILLVNTKKINVKSRMTNGYADVQQPDRRGENTADISIEMTSGSAVIEGK